MRKPLNSLRGFLMLKNRVFSNAKWIIGCRIVQSLLQLVIGMISARYLGPSNYGLISYAASVVAFATPVMQLGLRSTLVQEYIGSPEKEGQILGTSLVMNLCSSVACIIGVACFTCMVNHGERTTILVCSLYSVSLFFHAADMIQLWFQAKLMSKYPSLAALGAYVLVSAYKIYLLASGKSVYWFALSYAVEYFVVAVVLFVVYYRVGRQKMSFSISLAKKMFEKSKYYIVSAMMVTIFQNTDHVMLKLMVGNMENGYYTTAATCAGLTTFVFTAIIDSARPVILESYKKSAEAFERNLAGTYAIVVYLALAQSLSFTLLASMIVKVLYGSAYLNSIPVLQIVVWYTSFSCMGAVRNIWILAEGKQRVLWKINLSGALMNVVLNAIMIPVAGASGAALASVLTQFFTNFVVGFIFKDIRSSNRVLLKGLNPRILLELIPKIR